MGDTIGRKMFVMGLTPFLLIGCAGPGASRTERAEGGPSPAIARLHPRPVNIAALAPSGRCAHRIDGPGGYELLADLAGVAGKCGVEVAADDVTIDLHGFTLRGVAGSHDGVYVVRGCRNVSIANGTVRDWGLAGVHAANAAAGQFRHLRLHDNGLTGLAAGPGSTVESCIAAGNGGDGIATDAGCVVANCAAWRNGVGDLGGDGIDAGDGSTISHCAGHENADHGIRADLGATVTACTARANGGDGIRLDGQGTASGSSTSFNDGDGIHAGGGSTIVRCTATLNGGDGIEVSSFCFVVENNAAINSLATDDGAGIRATGMDNRIDANFMTLNSRGLVVEDVNNFITRNRATHNGAGVEDEYAIVPDSFAGEITSEPSTAGPWANFR